MTAQTTTKDTSAFVGWLHPTPDEAATEGNPSLPPYGGVPTTADQQLDGIKAALKEYASGDGIKVLKSFASGGQILVPSSPGEWLLEDPSTPIGGQPSPAPAQDEPATAPTEPTPDPPVPEPTGPPAPQPTVSYPKSYSGEPVVPSSGDKELRALIKAISTEFGGNAVGRGRTVMTKFVKITWLTAWFNGDLATCYHLEQAVATPTAKHPGHPHNPASHWVTWAPAVDGEVPAGVWVQGNWSSPDLPHCSAYEVDNYLIQARMAHPRYLTNSMRRAWVRAHLRGDKVTVDQFSLRAKFGHDNGHWKSSSPPVWSDLPQQAPHYTQYLGSGIAAGQWPVQTLTGYLAEHHLPPAHRWADLVASVQTHLDHEAEHKAAQAAALQLHVLPDQPTLTGTHRKTVLGDQHDRRWIFKPAPSDSARFRPETEHEAHTLARLWGFPTAESSLITFQDSYGQLQAAHPVAYNLACFSGEDFTKLSTGQLCALAREHCLDWALDNDDTHGDNIIITLDGTVVGIDKGRAWRYFGGWPGLSGDAAANTNAPLIYTELYTAIANHVLHRDTVDVIFRAVITTARRMQRLSDHSLATIIGRAVANRPHYNPSSYQQPIPGAPSSAAELITAATARKSRLVADMTLLWQRVYTRAGWELPAPTGSILGLNAQGHVLHSGLHSPELHEAIGHTKSYGTATFVAGTEVEDGHILLWRERRPDATFSIRGQFKVRHPAFTAIRQWCVHHAQPDQAPSPPCPLPLEADAYDRIIMAAKTISFHHGDKAYNQAKLEAMNYTKAQLTRHLALTQAYITAGTSDPAGQLAATAQMAQQYLSYIDVIEQTKADGGTTRVGQFPRYHYVPADPPAPEPAQPTVKLVPAARPAAHPGNTVKLAADGELALSTFVLTNTTEQYGQAGKMYQITLPTGECIEFRGGTDTGTPLALQGQVQFTIDGTADLATSLHAVQDQLAVMGLTLTGADLTDLELFYWRHLRGVINDRAGTSAKTETGARLRAFHVTVAGHNMPGTFTSREQEITLLRAAFACLTSTEQVDGWLAGDGHLPRFMHMDLRNPDQPTGKPYWERFDVTTDMWRSRQLPSLTYKTGPIRVVESGVCLSTEARIRTLAIWKSGMSSKDDLYYGSSAYVFCRQNQQASNGATVYFSPRTLARTHNYAYSTDRYGKIAERHAYAAFDFDTMTGHCDGANELMVKDALSLLDDVEILVFLNEADRTLALNTLAELGITQIRNIATTMRFITRYDGNAKVAALAAVRKSYQY